LRSFGVEVALAAEAPATSLIESPRAVVGLKYVQLHEPEPLVVENLLGEFDDRVPEPLTPPARCHRYAAQVSSSINWLASWSDQRGCEARGDRAYDVLGQHSDRTHKSQPVTQLLHRLGVRKIGYGCSKSSGVGSLPQQLHDVGIASTGTAKAKIGLHDRHADASDSMQARGLRASPKTQRPREDPQPGFL
jgi:hypothetical protein